MKTSPFTAFSLVALTFALFSISANANVGRKLNGTWKKMGEHCLATKSALGTPQSAQTLTIALKKHSGKFVVNTQITEQCHMSEASDLQINGDSMVTMSKVVSYDEPCQKAVIAMVDPTVHVIHYKVRFGVLKTSVRIAEDDGACAKGDSLITTYRKQ